MAKTRELLNEKDCEIVKRVAAGERLATIGQEVLGETKYPSQYVYKRLQRPHVRARLLQAIERSVGDDETLAKLLRKLLKARRIKTVEVVGSRIKRKIREPDYDVICKALDMLFKLKGSYMPSQVEIQSAVQTQEAILEMLAHISQTCPDCGAYLRGQLARLNTDSE